MNGRKHTREFKIQVCKQVEIGEKRLAQICREHKPAESSLLKWRKEYQARGEAALPLENQPKFHPTNWATKRRLSF
jgi:transposase-like protein